MIRWLSIIIYSFLLLVIPNTGFPADELNCVLCHKHRGLSRIDEDGKFRLFYINEGLFESGPHRRNKCKDCHSDIDKIPHDPAKKVDCMQECHMVEPSAEVKFSHKPVEKTLHKSVHSPFKKDGTPKPHQEDYPGCKDCHDQPFYRPFSFSKGELKAGMTKRGVGRCKSCHTKGDFAEVYYEHVTTRLRKSRFPMETIKTCAKCHQDPGLLERHDMDDAVTTYMQTFHGKLIALGSEKTADCLDCHIVEGENNHMIEAKEVVTSATHKNNVQATCRTAECHAKAAAQIASYQTHVTYDREKYPLQFYMLLGFKALMAFVLYFFLVLIFLELMRRLFPDFSFFKEKKENE